MRVIGAMVVAASMTLAGCGGGMDSHAEDGMRSC